MPAALSERARVLVQRLRDLRTELSGDEVVANEQEPTPPTLLDRVQREYPDKPEGPDDGWWQPAHLGGTAPTLAQAAELDAEHIAARGGR